jgi:tetratricopeptide (TPR) repeat protein
MRISHGLALLLALCCASAGALAGPSDAENCGDPSRSATERVTDCTAALAAPNLNKFIRAQLLDDRGWAHSDRAEYDQAVADFTAAVADVSTLDRLAIELMTGGISGSSASKDAASDSAIPYGDAFLGRSAAEGNLGRYPESIADARTAAQWFRSPQMDSQADSNVAWSERLSGDLSAAEASYRKSLETYADNDSAEFLYATLLFALGRDQEALPLLRRSFVLNQGFGYTAFWIYDHVADRDGEGKQALRDYLETVDDDAWPAAIAHYDLGDLDADHLLAATAGATATKTRENLCEAQYYLAEALRLAGKTDQARLHYQAAIDTGVTWFVEYQSAKLLLAAR